MALLVNAFLNHYEILSWFDDHLRWQLSLGIFSNNFFDLFLRYLRHVFASGKLPQFRALPHIKVENIIFCFLCQKVWVLRAQVSCFRFDCVTAPLFWLLFRAFLNIIGVSWRCCTRAGRIKPSITVWRRHKPIVRMWQELNALHQSRNLYFGLRLLRSLTFDHIICLS